MKFEGKVIKIKLIFNIIRERFGINCEDEKVYIRKALI